MKSQSNIPLDDLEIAKEDSQHSIDGLIPLSVTPEKGNTSVKLYVSPNSIAYLAANSAPNMFSASLARSPASQVTPSESIFLRQATQHDNMHHMNKLRRENYDDILLIAVMLLLIAQGINDLRLALTEQYTEEQRDSSWVISYLIEVVLAGSFLVMIGLQSLHVGSHANRLKNELMDYNNNKHDGNLNVAFNYYRLFLKQISEKSDHNAPYLTQHFVSKHFQQRSLHEIEEELAEKLNLIAVEFPIFKYLKFIPPGITLATALILGADTGFNFSYPAVAASIKIFASLILMAAVGMLNILRNVKTLDWSKKIALIDEVFEDVITVEKNAQTGVKDLISLFPAEEALRIHEAIEQLSSGEKSEHLEGITANSLTSGEPIDFFSKTHFSLFDHHHLYFDQMAVVKAYKDELREMQSMFEEFQKKLNANKTAILQESPQSEDLLTRILLAKLEDFGPNLDELLADLERITNHLPPDKVPRVISEFKDSISANVNLQLRKKAYDNLRLKIDSLRETISKRL